MPYNPEIRSNIIFSPSPWPNGGGFWPKFLHSILSSIMRNKCPFHLMSFNSPNHISTNKAFEGGWRLQNRAQLIHTVQYFDKLVKEETVLEDVIVKRTEIGR